MKKILLLTTFTLFLFSCSNKEKNASIDTLIKSKNLTLIQEKRAELQSEIVKLDKAIASLNTKKEETLVTLQTVKDTVFTHFLEIQGNVETKENIIIYPQYSGVLTTLNVKAGQRVNRGQLLGRIDDGGLSQQVSQLESQLALAKTTFERQKRLWDQKIGSEIQFLQAQTNMISQQKAVSQIKSQLSKTTIVAPFSGIIDEVLVEKGQVIGPGQGLMRIVNLNNMYVSASVPEIYISKLNVGSTVNATIPSLGKEYNGKIRQVGSYINPTNRSFSVEVAINNTGNLLRPNQVAKLKIIDYTKKNAITVPSNIIQEDATGAKFVYVASQINGKTAVAKKAMITVGQTAENNTEILSGLQAEDVIVIEGVNSISEGIKLNF